MSDIKTWLNDFHKSWSTTGATDQVVVISETETKALLEYLQEEIHVQKAAEIITSGIEQEEDIEYGVSRLWWCIIDGAIKFGNSHEKFLQLLKAIKLLHFQNEDERELDFDDAGRLWEDLPEFSFLINDCWNYTDAPVDVPRQIIKNRNEWLNLNKFTALLTANNVLRGRTFALWSLRSALEQDFDQIKNALDGYIPAAVQWIVYAGTLLYECEKEYPVRADGGSTGSGGPLWNGKTGFCQERWTFWKNRFEQVQSISELADSTKSAAKKAVTEMDKIEKEHKKVLA